MSDPKEFSDFFHDLPTDIPELCQIVHGILLHGYLADQYGATLSENRKPELNIRAVSDQLARIQELEAQKLTVSRAPEKRLFRT